MIIREVIKEPEVIAANCDACKADLIDVVGTHTSESGIKEEFKNVNYAQLKCYFGYGSRLDNVGDDPTFELCEDCYEKVLKVLNLFKEE